MSKREIVMFYVGGGKLVAHAAPLPDCLRAYLDALGDAGQDLAMHILRAWHEEKVASGSNNIDACYDIITKLRNLAMIHTGEPALCSEQALAVQSLLEVQGLLAWPSPPSPKPPEAP